MCADMQSAGHPQRTRACWVGLLSRWRVARSTSGKLAESTKFFRRIMYESVAVVTLSRAVNLCVCVLLASGAALLAGCSSSGNTATITYETGSGTKTEEFSPGGVTCNDWGASGLNFPEKPYNGLSLFDDVPGEVSVWEKGKQLVLFYSDDAVVKSTPYDDGSVEYQVVADVGEVAVTEVLEPLASGEPDLSEAKHYPGTLRMQIRCMPESAE